MNESQRATKCVAKTPGQLVRVLLPGADTAEGERLGMTVEGQSGEELTPFTGEARAGFREYLVSQAR